MQVAFSPRQIVERYSPQLDRETAEFLDSAVDTLVATKNRNGKLMVVNWGLILVFFQKDLLLSLRR